MFNQIYSKLNSLQEKYKDAHLILGGDFNDAPDDTVDRIPERISHNSQFKATLYLSEKLSVTDVWRFFNPNYKEFTWSNSRCTQQSRIDLWLTSTSCLQYISEVSHCFAPLSDHKMITVLLVDSKENNKLHGYWKLNNNLLKDKTFQDSAKLMAQEIFNQKNLNGIQKWEYFKFKVRETAIRRSKDIKKDTNKKEKAIMDNLNVLLNKENLSEDEKVKLMQLQSEIDKLYVDAAKGAFIRSRARWLENGEKNTSYFFALEKRNFKRNNISSLQINNYISTNPKEIAEHAQSFYKELYTSKFEPLSCDEFLDKVKEYIPTISDEFKSNCEKPLLNCEVVEALKRMKTGKSPGIDGLTTEFYLCFWDIIDPLMEMYRECIDKEEMSTTMKQGIISLIPKPNKDPLSIENWRLITLLNVDYKLFALVFAKRLKSNLAEIINETQTGFMANRHISNNIRLVLDLLDYSEYVESQAIIVFLDFYKAFDTVEHPFIYKALNLFGFGGKFISVVKMLYKDINSNLMIYPNTSNRFPVNRSVRQGCPISPFLFLIVVELLSLQVLNSPSIQGLSIFQKEIRIIQLADDTALFLRDKNQIGPALRLINAFSRASGLQLNIRKCEILSLFDTDDEHFYNIPVKKTVKYLGIDVTKDMLTRQQLNFLPRLKKTKNIMNMWLQRDLSIFGRILFTKAEGISRLVYPALSLYVQDSTAKEINTVLSNFAWKNRHHYLKKRYTFWAQNRRRI